MCRRNVIPPAPSSPPPSPTWPLHILYADDMVELRKLMSHMLALDGHTVETVEDGEQALARVTASPAQINLIITDHHMPKIDGLELAWRIRQLPYRGKVVVFSSELSEEVNARYYQLGVDLILAKPVIPSAFRQRLRQLFNREAPGTPPPGTPAGGKPRRPGNPA
jgi:CheY-like chemotaxis protein